MSMPLDYFPAMTGMDKSKIHKVILEEFFPALKNDSDKHQYQQEMLTKR